MEIDNKHESIYSVEWYDGINWISDFFPNYEKYTDAVEYAKVYNKNNHKLTRVIEKRQLLVWQS